MTRQSLPRPPRKAVQAITPPTQGGEAPPPENTELSLARQCPRCHDHFTALGGRAVYCSDYCRWRAWYDRKHLGGAVV